MLVCIEGVDGAGKTTLAQQLREAAPDLDVHLLHRGPPSKHVLIEYELDLEPYDPAAAELWILDRWHVGELIYGPLYRGESKLTPAMYRHVEMFLDSIGAVKILLSPPIEYVEQRLAHRGEDFLQSHHIKHVYDEYERILSASDRWSVFKQTPNPELVINAAARRAKLALATKPFTTYVGEPFPQLLLVGERHGVGAGRDRPRYRAAFVPYADTSGAFLLGALEEADGFLSYGLANALQDNVGDLWEVLGRPDIVALGTKANRELDRLNIPHGSVPHPQYVRRFLHGRGKAYAQSILQAAQKKEATWPL